MGIPVKLEVFEGPLDLLLHLIDKNKVDIYDIPIVEITNQYMEYIQEMQKQDLNIMSEFLSVYSNYRLQISFFFYCKHYNIVKSRKKLKKTIYCFFTY